MSENINILSAKATVRLNEATTLLNARESLILVKQALLQVVKKLLDEPQNQASLSLLVKKLLNTVQEINDKVDKPLADLSDQKVSEGIALTSVFTHEAKKLTNKDNEGEDWKKA